MIIEGISNDDYHSSPELSRSTAWNVLKTCPARVRYDKENPGKSSSALILGNGFHSAFLEPKLFEEEYEIKPKQIDGNSPLTKAYKEKFQQMKDENPGKTWLSLSEWEMCSDMANSASSHSFIQEQFQNDKFIIEGTGFFECEGIKCKVRPDLYSPTSGMIIDLKSTQDASEEAFRLSVKKFGYGFQVAWYMEGLRRMGCKATDFVFLAVEKKPPYLRACYRVNQFEIDHQIKQMKRACKLWKQCVQAETFPGYSPEIITL